jgi:prepilin-type N-terminal cleavage/methylation domain-containing protein
MPRSIGKPVMRGFSLIEMMVAMLIGAMVAIGAVSLIVAIDRSNSETIQATRINQELRALASVIGDEIKRSRRLHDPLAWVGQGGSTNGTFDFVDTSTAGCIVYGYQDATLDTGATAAVNNYQSIYLKTTSGVGSVVFAKSTSAVTCSTAGTTLTSTQLNITDLKFYCVTTDGTNVSDVANTTTADTTQVQESCSEIDVSISAKLIAGSGDTFETGITRTYVQQVFIRSGAAKTS